MLKSKQFWSSLKKKIIIFYKDVVKHKMHAWKQYKGRSKFYKQKVTQISLASPGLKIKQ